MSPDEEAVYNFITEWFKTRSQRRDVRWHERGGERGVSI
jgi:hypothetical protein